MASIPKIIAVDPGVSGAVVGYYPRTHELFVHRDFKNVKDIVQAVNTCANGEQDQAVIEQVGSRPGQGIVSTSHFMIAYGTAMGALGMKVLLKNLRSPVYHINPSRWQNWVRREIGVSDNAKVLSQQSLYNAKFEEFDSRVYATSCFPDNAKAFSRAKDHNTADAALLAVYCFWYGRETALRAHLHDVWAHWSGHRVFKPIIDGYQDAGLSGIMKPSEDTYTL